ncbi:RNA ligase [Frigoribacterium sp. VKM Ac-2530]|uniref:RNA ligase n=1 Tax=Frigoribacterium sp. VKM Ac-2530 TaxID=2783822 RepID=UPI00188D4C21|nr:RNA ligase [Frigoribacterium sp. VKM Ac-2530]MBF4578926.1 hypothetical protein [Frigoribacterium sp. VKM Ac-2530]
MTTTTLDQILDPRVLEQEIAAGYINRRLHPEFPELALIGYSDRAQYDNHWTPTVRAARGIIYRTDTLEVLARPFEKFFNYGQEAGVEYDLDAPILGAFNKFDGSLGIGYMRPDGRFAIATRGSFDSEQARHATENIGDWATVAHAWQNIGATPLFEIIYPDNRIVLNYGDRDELVFLGEVDIATGAYRIPASWNWAGASAGSTLREVLAVPPRVNAEGFVAWIDEHTAVKFKQDDYLALHRVISNLTVKEVWRQLRAGTYDAFVVALPDEFHTWSERTAQALMGQFVDVARAVYDAHIDLDDLDLPDRKAQALWIKEHVPAHLRGFVFSALDDRTYNDGIWRTLEPHGGGAEIATATLTNQEPTA